MEQLTPLDNFFCLLEQPNAPMQIGGLMILDQSTAANGFLRHKELLTYIEDRLHLAKGFRQRIVESPYGIDYPYAVEDENFDLEFHVRHMGLPAPGDWRQLCILTARIMSRPLDMQRPPWELYIIERLDNVEGIPENSFAVILKIHHAIADGISAAEMITALLQTHPEQEPHYSNSPWVAERAPGRLEMWARATPNLAGQVWRSASQGVKAVHNTLQVRGQLSDSGRESLEVPRTRFNDTLTPHRVFDATEWPIEDAKALTQLVDGAKINDVMVSVIGGAVRRYMKLIDELPDSSMVALCPISVRTQAALKDGGNKVSGMRIAIGSDIEDPIDRMRAIQEQTDLGKKVLNQSMADALDSWVAALPPVYGNALKALSHRFHLQARMPPLANTLITNVQSPTLHANLYMAGAKIVSSFGVPPLAHGFGFGHVVGNSTGRVNVSVGADRTMLPDTDLYIECLKQSFLQHQEALSIKIKDDEKNQANKRLKKAASNKEVKKKKTKPRTSKPKKVNGSDSKEQASSLQ